MRSFVAESKHVLQNFGAYPNTTAADIPELFLDLAQYALLDEL